MMKAPVSSRSGFTLVEIMIVVAILGIVMRMGLPAIFKSVRQESLRQSVSDIVEVCSHARAQAILQGKKTEVVIHPKDRQLGVGGVGGSVARTSDFGTVGGAPGSHRAAAQWSDRLVLEMLDVNFIEHKDDDEARVCFFPNGTSDEMTIILRSEHNEYRKISLEVTTGLASVEVIR
jgi:prepilin-type N-terminal cleavage/methylation domain-containing protein